MKRITKLLGIMLIISIGFTGCNKSDPPANNNNTEKGIDDLIISDNFDWKTTKTLDVKVTLPIENHDQIVKIFSINASELYYVGYANNGNLLSTKVTIPASEETVRVIYGFDNAYDPILVTAVSDIICSFDGLKSSRDDCDLDGLVTYKRNEWGADW